MMRRLALALLILAAATSVAAALRLPRSFGAIAYSRPEDIIGKANDSGTKADAERWALADCRDKGGSACEILTTVYGECATLAIGKDGFAVVLGYRVSETLGGAALTRCLNRTTNCRLRDFVCGR